MQPAMNRIVSGQARAGDSGAIDVTHRVRKSRNSMAWRHIEFGIVARSAPIRQIKHAIARFPVGYLRANRFDDSCGIDSQDMRISPEVAPHSSDLEINRIE